jgi:hypothetical protein
MKIYEEIKDEFGTIIKATDGDKVSWIPTDPANSDYAAYLEQIPAKTTKAKAPAQVEPEVVEPEAPEAE